MTLAYVSDMLIVAIAKAIVKKRGETMRIDKVKFVSELARQDMTLLKLADKSGVNRVTLSNIKCGKSCREDIGLKIAKALNVKVEDLM